MFLVLLKRELALALRNLGGLMVSLMFFVVVVTLFPFAVSADTAALERIAGGVIWVAALLAVLLSMDDFYREDYADGSLAQLMISSPSTYLVAFSKGLAHWLTAGLPLVLVAPFLGYGLHLPQAASGALVLSLLLGTPTLCFLGGMGAALTLGNRRQNILIPVLVIPLMIPALIFGAAIVNAAAQNISYNSPTAFLAAILILAVILAPLATGRALKLSLE